MSRWARQATSLSNNADEVGIPASKPSIQLVVLNADGSGVKPYNK